MNVDLDKFFEVLETQKRIPDDSAFIYVGQPYGHEDPEVVAMRVDEIVAVVAKIEAAYPICRVYSPIMNKHPLAEKDHYPDGGWYFSDVTRWLRHADFLIVTKLEGWQESYGLLIEIAFALGCGIPIYFMDPDGEVPFLSIDDAFDGENDYF